MISVLATVIVLLVLALVLRATSYRHQASRDPVVIDMEVLRLAESRERPSIPAAAAALPLGPVPSSPFDQQRDHQLPTGPPPPPSRRARPAGGLPGPDPPRPVGALLEASTGPPSYGPSGQDAYCA